MTKNEYLAELKSRLISLSAEERDAAIKYYEEFFADAGEGNEQSVIDELGSPDALAESIINETNRTEKSSTEYIPANITDIKKEEEKQQNNKKYKNTSSSTPKKNNNIALIILLILTSPVTIPIALALAGTLFGLSVALLAVVFSIMVAFGALALGLTLGGIAAVILGIARVFVMPLEGFVGIGIGLIILAFGLLAIIPFIMLCSKVIPAVIRGIVNVFSRIFNRKAVTA